MGGIINFFKSFNKFLNFLVQYLDERVLTGKFIEDISFQWHRFSQFIIKVGKKIYTELMRSENFANIMSILNDIWQSLMTVSFFNVIVSFFTETLHIVIKCYSEIFITFAITFPLTILLLNWFQTTIVTFCWMFLPILFIDIICISALYYCINKRESEDKISIWESLLFVIRHCRSFGFPIIAALAIFLESFLIFIITSLFFSYTFQLLHLNWGSSILYWFIVIVLAAIIVFGLFVMSILIPQIYFTVLLDQLPFHDALAISKKRIRRALFYYLFFSILFYIICANIIWHASLSSLYLGFTIAMYFTVALGIFLAFLMKRKFSNFPIQQDNPIAHHKMYFRLNIIIFFGFINYILLSFLVVKEYHPFTTLILQQHADYLLSQEMKQYTNNTYGYSLSYPQDWSVYQWQNNSVTFYNNYTDTLSGGTWLTITISPYNGSNFDDLYNAAPGVVANDPQNKDIISKVSNMNIQNYPTVNYLFTKPGIPYTHYETHYLIHKDKNVYDIAFTSVTNDVASYNSTLFTTIINSFKFTQ